MKSPRRLSLELIEQLEPIEHQRFEAMMKDMYEAIPADQNVMNTSLGRYADAGDFTIDTIMECLGAGSDFTFHDMAVSNAITSVELYKQLAGRARVSFLATDKYTKCTVATTDSGQWRIVFNADNRALQYIGYGFVLSAERERRRYPVNRALKHFVERRILPPLQAELNAGSISSDRVRTISLFHPSARALASSDSLFALGEHDITQPADFRADVVRMMGVVNAFPKNRRPLMLGRVAGSVREGGLLILGDRRPGKSTNMTVYRRRKDRVIPIRHRELPYTLNETVCALRLTEA